MEVKYFHYDKFMLISTPNIFDQGQVIDRQSDTLKPVNRFVLGQHICQIISQSEPGSWRTNQEMSRSEQFQNGRFWTGP